QILGDCAPLAAGAEDVHQAVDHLAQVDRALIATRFGRWDRAISAHSSSVRSLSERSLTAVIAGAVLFGPHGMPPKIDAGAGNGNGISGFKTNPLTDSNDSICSRTDTQGRTPTMTAKGLAPLSLAVSTVVRTSASASAAHMAR